MILNKSIKEKIMTPEEIIDKERWYVLRKIREEFLRTKAGSNIDYCVCPDIILVGSDAPSPGDEITTLEKLEELGAIKILNPGGTGEYEI